MTQSTCSLKKAICVGVGLKSEPITQIKENLLELIDLTQAAGAEVVGSITQTLQQWNPSLLIGSGKADEIKLMISELGANLVVIDHQLSGGQTRNLEKLWGVTVLDRNQVILDIFAQRARTFEGKLQVELAQMMDQLPRMVGAWMDSLSRQGGGIGTRGPGETALENDKRRIRERIQVIRKKLEVVRKNRAQNREARKQSDITTFALVGYTNSGKSSLLQRLTGADVFIKNQPFATLDPTTRKVFLGQNFQAVITDTVGFIRKIPTQLIEAFKATLEESTESDVLIHVIDLSHPSRDSHIAVVEAIIEELGWKDKNMIYVYNKVDAAPPSARFQVKGYPRVFVSALTGEGIDNLKDILRDTIASQSVELNLYFNLEQSDLIFDLTREALILKQEKSAAGTFIRAKIRSDQASKWKEFSIQ
jgi:GTP-binding protein HflX